MARTAAVAPVARKRSSSATEPRPRRGAKGEDTRERILAATMQVLADSGFRGLRVAEVAKQVGITEAGVLHHYPSKQALLEAVLEYRERPALLLLPGIEDLRGVEAILGYARLAKLIQQNPVRAQLLIVLKAENLGQDRFAGDYFRKREKRLESFIEGHVREGQADGEIRSDVDPKEVAIEVTSMMGGINLQWFTLNRRFDLHAAWLRYLEGLVVRIGTTDRRPS